MELLDRYLQAVKKHLPWRRQDDIIAELRANLYSQLEDKEAALGRPLTQSEAEAWLKELDPPIQMAARYQPPRYLIGPAVFPTYRHVVRLAWTWGFIIYSIMKVVEIFTVPNPGAGAMLDYFFGVPALFFGIAAWCTLVFAVFEFAVARHWEPVSRLAPLSAGWAPCTLPPLEPAAPGNGKKPRSFGQALVELGFALLGLLWLLLVPHHLWLLFGPGAAYLEASPYRLASALVPFYWCVVALNVIQLGLQFENLARGRWQRPPTWQKIAREVFALVPLVPLLVVSGHAFVVLKHPAQDETLLGPGLATFNDAVFAFLLFVTAITILQLAWSLGKLGLKTWRTRAAAAR